MKKFISLSLIIIIISSFVFPIEAATTNETSITPRYTYLEFISTDISINANTGKATCTATCSSVSGYTVKIVCELQQYRNSTWTTLQTWNASGNVDASVTGNRYISQGYKYRAYATYYVYNTSGRQVEKVTNYDSLTY